MFLCLRLRSISTSTWIFSYCYGNGRENFLILLWKREGKFSHIAIYGNGRDILLWKQEGKISHIAMEMGGKIFSYCYGNRRENFLMLLWKWEGKSINAAGELLQCRALVAQAS